MPHGERTWAGVRFQPACGTIDLANAGYGMFQMLAHVRADGLETTNIHFLFLGGLRELIVLTKEDAETETVHCPKDSEQRGVGRGSLQFRKLLDTLQETGVTRR